MEARELRIGNLVYNDGYLDNITSVIDVDLYWIKPIPITKEWLLKLGLEEEGPYENKTWYRIENGNFSYEISNKRFYLESDADYETYVVDCEYVHKLQNLYFALTGDELAIK